MSDQIPQTFTIKKIIQENAAVKTYIFDRSVCGKPGQFVNVWIPRMDEKPMSIAYDDSKSLSLTICEVGSFSRAIASKKVGDKLGIRGPYGKPFHWQKKQHLIMVAGGYGAAPLFFASKMAIQDGCTIDFILGARTKNHLLYLKRLGLVKGLKLHISTDDGSCGHKGYNIDILTKILGETRMKTLQLPGAHFLKKKADWVFTCGPEMMMKRVSDICFEKNIKAQVSVERYMKCGFGICGQCCVDESGMPVCIEGPVMDNDTARMIEEFGKYHRDSEGRKVYF
ncbi:dihydroorotate dehydrogenase electron transfer subunit [Candidatus Peregrinibacteria bacterium]|nr:dihydroorotate dehydrogenase electron transfer subunit [Candidatus Peregrinibacteria bacterium]